MTKKLGRALASLRKQLVEINFDELPCVPMTDRDFNQNLPGDTTAVYFVRSPLGETLYIGRATNLRARWRDASITLPDGSPYQIVEHHRLKKALDHGGCNLYWMTLPKEYLGVVERILIELHEPPWNGIRESPESKPHNPDARLEEFRAWSWGR